MLQHDETSPFTRSQEAILQAALSFVQRSGGLHLTIDAVAAESGFSKGGVLYNFKTKDQLVVGMVRYLSRQFASEVSEARLKHTASDCPTLAAMMDVTERWLDEQQTVTRAILVTSVGAPELMEPFVSLMRGYKEAMQAETRNFARALAVWSALEGMHFADAHCVSLTSNEERGAIFAYLRGLLENKD